MLVGHKGNNYLSPSLAKKAGNSVVDTSRAYINGESEKNKYNHSEPESMGRIYI